MKQAKYNVYDVYDFKELIGTANNYVQVEAIANKRIDETDSECLIDVKDNETGRYYTFEEFAEEVQK